MGGCGSKTEVLQSGSGSGSAEQENAALRKQLAECERRLAECEKKLEQALKETSSKPAPSAAESRPPRSWRSTSRRREDGVGTYRGASR